MIEYNPRKDNPKQYKTRHYNIISDKARQDNTIQANTWDGQTRYDKTRQYDTRKDKAMQANTI